MSQNDQPETQGAPRIFFNAICVGGASGIIFFILTASAAFLVTGDGNASRFTYFMLSLVDYTADLFGVSQGKIFPATLFYAVVSFIAAFILQILALARKWHG